MEADLDVQGDNAPQPAANPPPKKAKKQPPQKTINQFWDAFVSKHPGGVETILPDKFYTKDKTTDKNVRGAIGRSVGKSYDQAATDCKAAVAKIAKECRRINTKYRDPHFDIEFDLKLSQWDCLNGLVDSDWSMYPKAVKRVGDIFEAPVFFEEGASANDIRQGSNGDCWFLSALTALTTKKDLINKVCVARDEKVGVYGFVFHRDGEWTQTIIDDKLYLTHADWAEIGEEKWDAWLQINREDAEEEYRKSNQVGSRALYFAQCRSENETWLPLIEKAYAKAHGDFNAIQGGWTGEGIEDLTGGVTTEMLATDILDTDLFWKEEIMKVNDDFLFGCATGLLDRWQGNYADSDRKDIVAAHAYSILEAREIKGERLLKLRNPWGKMEWRGAWSDGSEQWTPEWMELLNHRFGDDGIFWISYKDLLKKYQNFDRTRLFGPEWSVTQQWTSVDVPWAADYNDTKFTITVTKDTPIVIVLTKLDDRYFQGLEGQYRFSLHFRVDCDGDEEYLVRSRGAYFMDRAVSVDLDIEPGTYSVLMKITAERNTDAITPDQVIKDKCKDHPEKLIQTGLAYDLAHAKGKYKESAGEKKERETQEARQKDFKHQKKKAELRGNEWKRWNVGRKRVQRNKRHEAAKIRHDERRATRLAKEQAEKEQQASKDRDETANDADDEDETKPKPNIEQAEGESGETNPEVADPEGAAAQESKPGDAKVDEAGGTEVEESKGSASSEDAPVVITPPEEESAENKKTTEEPVKESDDLTESKAATETQEDADKVGETPQPKTSQEEQKPLENKPEGTTEASPETVEVPIDGTGPVDDSVAESAAVQPSIAPAPAEDNPDWAYDSDASFQSSIVTELDMTPEDDAPKKEITSEETKPEDDEDLKEWAEDPWNAVCVVGLRVYSKDPGLVIKVVRPRRLDDEETPPDPDDINKTIVEETVAGDKTEEQKETENEKKEESWKEEKEEGGKEGTEGSEGKITMAEVKQKEDAQPGSSEEIQANEVGGPKEAQTLGGV